MRYKLLVAVLSFFIVLNLHLKAQNVGINSSGAIPDASAMLDVSATNMGILIPRVALSQTGLATPITTPSTSLLVYNTVTINDVTPGYYYWDGSQWVRFLTGSQSDDWTLLGNAGTIDGTNFIGTIDNVPLSFRVNNTHSGRIASDNTSYGYNAGRAITSGTNNVLIGEGSGYNLSTADDNVAIGHNALYGYMSSNVGDNNVAIGWDAMFYTTDKSSNVAIGKSALSLPPGGVIEETVAIGYYSDKAGTTPNHSVAIGARTEIGAENTTAIGYRASATQPNSMVLGSINGVNGATANTSVAIGTTAPTAQFHTTGSVRFQGAGTPAAGRVLTSDANGNATWQAPSAGGADFDWEVSGNNIFTGHGGSYPSGGYLGIGTATPAKLVHIIGDNSTPEDFVIEDNGGTYSYLHMCIRNKTGSGTMSYSFSQQGGNMHFAGLDFDPDTEELILRNNYHSSNGFGNGVITFNTRNASGSAERMRVDNDGNVGIAETNPVYRLDVRSSFGVALAGVNPANFIKLNASSAASLAYIAFNNLGKLEFRAQSSSTYSTSGFGASSTIMTIDGTTKRVGIGTTLPQAKLNIGGATGAQGGFAIGDGTAISTTDGSRRSIQIATDNNYGGTFDNHTGYLIYSIMPGGWGSGELHFCTGNNWGTYATGTPALRVTQTTTYANGTALTSDKRLKKDVQENPYGIETIMQLKALKYKKLIVDSFANGEMVFNKSIQIDEVGFFAQDVYNIIPEVVLKPKDESKETWAIDYSKIVPILTQAIQDQQEIINNLKEEHQQKIEELEKQNREILQRLEELEKNN